MTKCPFCGFDRERLENTILDETNNFYVLPALGSLVDGYVLIVSKRHINSMSELTSDELVEYEILIKKYRNIFKSVYNRYPIVFEHGTPFDQSKLKANSVDHAHTHIVNHNFDDEKALLKKENFKRVRKIADIINCNGNYIFYINEHDETYISYEFEAIKQLMRIEIAKDLDLLNMYDWHLSRFQDNIIKTIEKIKERLHPKK